MIPDLHPAAVLHGGCAVVYALLAALILARPPVSRTAAWLGVACASTAFWAADTGSAWAAPVDGLAPWAEIGRSAAWYGFILHLYRRSAASNQQVLAAFRIMGLLALLVLGSAVLLDWYSSPAIYRSLGIAARLGFVICNLLLLENLYFNTPADSRWHVNLLCIALGGILLYDLLLYADGMLFRRLSVNLAEGRAPVMTLAAPLITLAAIRDRRWAVDIHVSRDVAFHGFTLIASGVFLLSVGLVGEAFRRGGSEWGRITETCLIFASLLGVAVTLTSGSARSRIRMLIAEHFFSGRYDYRREWMRCIDILTAPEEFIALHKRAIRSAAEVVDSPAGALFVRPPQDVAFQWAGSWNMPAVTAPVPPQHELVSHFAGGDWIVCLDEHAGSEGWLPELPRAWLVLPLNHGGALIGFVVLARSRAQFKLDLEVFNLLRVVGREIASRVAEQRVLQVLTQTQHLREYSQRFAFVIHDIKNVAGQLSMLLSNAETYADDPEFQRDMLATVRSSVSKITRLLSRLQGDREQREHGVISPSELLPALIETRSKNGRRTIVLSDRSDGAGVTIDADAFDAVAGHLLDNAVEASAPDTLVEVDLRVEAQVVVVDIKDRGAGMAAEFIRDDLFRPLRTTKRGGHGIGAYQAREILRGAGGDLLVLSRPLTGTTMRMVLPLARSCVGEPVPVEA